MNGVSRTNEKISENYLLLTGAGYRFREESEAIDWRIKLIGDSNGEHTKTAVVCSVDLDRSVSCYPVRSAPEAKPEGVMIENYAER